MQCYLVRLIIKDYRTFLSLQLSGSNIKAPEYINFILYILLLQLTLKLSMFRNSYESLSKKHFLNIRIFHGIFPDSYTKSPLS